MNLMEYVIWKLIKLIEVLRNKERNSRKYQGLDHVKQITGSDFWKKKIIRFECDCWISSLLVQQALAQTLFSDVLLLNRLLLNENKPFFFLFKFQSLVESRNVHIRITGSTWKIFLWSMFSSINLMEKIRGKYKIELKSLTYCYILFKLISLIPSLLYRD